MSGLHLKKIKASEFTFDFYCREPGKRRAKISVPFFHNVSENATRTTSREGTSERVEHETGPETIAEDFAIIAEKPKAKIPKLDMGPQDQEQPGISTYQLKKGRQEEKWTELHSDLLKVRREGLTPQVCIKCRLLVGNIRCPDCGPNVHLCTRCSDEIHQLLQFHKVYEWKEDLLYLPIKPSPVLSQLPSHVCDQSRPVSVTLFDYQGCSIDASVETCGHEKLAVTLLRHGFWPASPICPKTAFSLQLLEMCVCLQLHSYVSVQAFVAALNQCDLLLGSRTQSSSSPDFYRSLLTVVNEYRFHRSTLRREGIQRIADFYSCPICSVDSSRMILSMDGNFGLVHKRRVDCHGTRHGNLFFQKDDDVENFSKSWDSNRRPCNGTQDESQECSQFQAGDALRAKNKTKKLDITGVFGSVCQHEIPQSMLNMKHGERMAYPVFILKQLCSNSQSLQSKQLILYDVGCMLQKHLTKRKSPLLQRFRFAVPAFHRFSHGLDCQLSYGQRCTPGAGLCDGEGMERLWAYLRKFSSSSKQMTLANRHDLLTDALLVYSHKSFCRLGTKLLQTLDTARKIKERSLRVFGPVEESDGCDARHWLEVWQKDLFDKKKTKGAQRLTAKEEYCLATVQLQEKQAQMAAAVQEDTRETLDLQTKQLELKRLRLKNQLRVEMVNNDAVRAEANAAKKKLQWKTLSTSLSLARQRKFLTYLLGKYADGQAVATRLGKQIQKNSEGLGRAREQLTALDVPVTVQDLVDTENIVYQQHLDVTCLSLSQEKAAIAKADYDRACEAEIGAKKDMISLLLFCKEKRRELQVLLHQDVECLSEKGERNLLCHRLLQLDCFHCKWAQEFSEHIHMKGLEYVPSVLMEKLQADEETLVVDFDEVTLEEVNSDDELELDLE